MNHLFLSGRVRGFGMSNAEVSKTWWIRLSLAFSIIGIFWLLIDAFGYIDWEKGPQRAILLLSVVMAAAVMILPGRHLRAGCRTIRKAFAWWIIVPCIAGLIFYNMVREAE